MVEEMTTIRPVRVVQISDCHLPGDVGQLFRGIEPHETLRRVMIDVSREQPDLLLASGDLSEDASAASYRSLSGYLNEAGVPVLALPGNHDDPVLLSEAFDGSPVETIAVSDHAAWQLIRLNSCLPERPEGRVAEAALDALEQHLNTQPPGPTVIALHHHPVLIGSPWIDKYPLLEPQRLLDIIDRHPRIRAVLWGHIHQVYAAKRGDTHMLGCPSTAINGRTSKPRFTPDTLGPSFRWFKLYPDGSIETGIKSI